MLSENQIVEVVRRGDPVSDPMDLPGPRLTAAELLSLAEREESSMLDTRSPTTPDVPRAPRWRGPAIAAAVMAAVLIVVGIVAALTSGANDQPVAASGCPAGSTPDTLGPRGQLSPRSAPAVNQAATFDEANGRVLYVDVHGATWAFDVCTNRWSREQTVIGPFSEYGAGDLVYDADAAALVGVEPGSIINVLADGTDTWTREYRPIGAEARGAVYDPVSGRVVVAYRGGAGSDRVVLWALDVDTGEWSEVGSVGDVWDGSWVFLIGYSETTDELVFHGGYEPDPDEGLGTADGAIPPTTVLYGLRSGATEVVTGGPNLFSPWGAWYPYATGVDGALVFSRDEGGRQQLCSFDAEARSWDECVERDAGYLGSASTMVFDSLNDRIVAISANGEVWAIDPDTGSGIELVDPNPN